MRVTKSCSCVSVVFAANGVVCGSFFARFSPTQPGLVLVCRGTDTMGNDVSLQQYPSSIIDGCVVAVNSSGFSSLVTPDLQSGTASAATTPRLLLVFFSLPLFLVLLFFFVWSCPSCGPGVGLRDGCLLPVNSAFDRHAPLVCFSMRG